MDRYSYNGPVLVFGNCVTSSWKGETFAISEKKAKSNLKYQYKKQCNLIASTKIELPGKIERY